MKLTSSQKGFKEPKISHYRKHLYNCAVRETTGEPELAGYNGMYAIQNYHSDAHQQQLQHLQPYQMQHHQSQPSVYNFGPLARLNHSLPSHMISMNTSNPIVWSTSNPNLVGHYTNPMNPWPAMTSNSKLESEIIESSQQHSEQINISSNSLTSAVNEVATYPAPVSTSSAEEPQRIQKAASGDDFSEFPLLRGVDDSGSQHWYHG